MAGTVEPVHTKYVYLIPVIFVLQILALPFWKEGGTEEPIVGGMPQWTYITLFFYTLAIVCIFLVFKSWVPPQPAAVVTGR